jgi:hypothetical protein
MAMQRAPWLLALEQRKMTIFVVGVGVMAMSYNNYQVLRGRLPKILARTKNHRVPDFRSDGGRSLVICGQA